MIKFENTEVTGWEAAIRGMRNPMNSWKKSDSFEFPPDDNGDPWIGSNDLDLMRRLYKAGTDHRKFMRMITVYVDITAPLYWWKEFDTYKVGTVANSCSTMHKITAREFDVSDFSHEHIEEFDSNEYNISYEWLLRTVDILNYYRKKYNAASEKLKKNITEAERKHVLAQQKYFWWQMIQILPSSYNQKRTVMMNYEVLANIYKSRKNHKLDEWAEHKEVVLNIDSSSQAKYAKSDKEYFGFCDWIKTLPYSELITGEIE